MITFPSRESPDFLNKHRVRRFEMFQTMLDTFRGEEIQYLGDIDNPSRFMVTDGHFNGMLRMIEACVLVLGWV
jgi:hypothetical protein